MLDKKKGKGCLPITFFIAQFTVDNTLLMRYGSSESSMAKAKTCSRYYGGSTTATKNYIFFKSFVMGSFKSLSNLSF
ncbi:hypothetical protein GPL06_11200 [Bacteroides salyersiae]|nr:hypothetical protein [Bacteroides salyersiae]